MVRVEPDFIRKREREGFKFLDQLNVTASGGGVVNAKLCRRGDGGDEVSNNEESNKRGGVVENGYARNLPSSTETTCPGQGDSNSCHAEANPI